MPADDAAYAALGRALVDALAPIVRDAVREAVEQALAHAHPMEASYVSPSQAAGLLGIHVRTFYRQVMPFVYSGVIASVKIGNARRIDRAALLHWVKQHSET